MKENIRNKVNTSLEYLEKGKGKLTVEEQNGLVEGIVNIINTMTVAEYTDAEIAEIEGRVASAIGDDTFSIRPKVEVPEVEITEEPEVEEIKTFKTDGDITSRSISVPRETADTIEENVNNKKMVKYAVAGMAVVTAAALAFGAYNLGRANGNVEAPVQDELTVQVVEPEETVVEKTEMDPEYVEIAESALAFAQNEVNNGLPENMQITEENKEQMTQSLVEYYLINQVDELTDEEWANIFQNSTVTAKDLMDAKYAWEWIDEQRVTTSQYHLDYSLLFDGEDAVLLNTSAEMLNKIKTTTGEEKKTAIKEFKEYITTNLGSDDMQIKYSSRALDTFRAVYFDAFDELTNHKEIDDELEHYVNTTITCGMENPNMDVQDPTIKSLQSEFDSYQTTKLETRLTTGWAYVAANPDAINKYNDISYMVEYVSNNLDLTNQFVLPNYEDTLASMFLTNTGAGKSKNDSGVSDGKGGIISQEQFDQYGIDSKDPNAKALLEQAVQEEEARKSEESAVIVESDGNTVNMNAADYSAEFSEGQADGISGTTQKAGKSSAYYNGYALGQQMRAEAQQQFGTGETTTFVPVDGEVNATETYTEQTYTEPATIVDTYTAPSTPGTTFVPADSSEEITEEITTYDYTGSIQRLRDFRDNLVASIHEDYSSGSKTV